VSVAVITGVSRGIGEATAVRFAERGLTLALLGRPSAGREATLQRCRRSGAEAQVFDCDLADAQAVDRAASRLLDTLGPPAVVVHNAAELQRGAPVHRIAVDDWDRLMATNLRGPFLLSRALLPHMLARGAGRLLFVSSVSGTIACPLMAHYGASKWGLIGLAKALAAELKDSGLEAVAILPGSVDTAMLKKTPFEPDMTADEVARVIVYYALDAPAAVNGAQVEIYG
jgi:3-oxoacyl-[acyl-carrier protein] reductase